MLGRNMDNQIKIHEIITKKELAIYWEKRNAYMREDIIPNCTLGEPISKEDEEWFFSKEYYDHIMGVYSRDVDKLYIVYFELRKKNIGFCVYVTFHSEDGKCFIVDFCIFKEYRNQGLGKKCFHLLEHKELERQATYFALNLSNENNQRFWKSLGFKESYYDEYNNLVYTYRP